MAPETPCVPFEIDFNEKEAETIRHSRTVANAATNSSSTTKRDVLILTANATPYFILKFFSQFAATRILMQWTTGPDLYEKFEAHLSDSHEALWVKAKGNDAQTVATFDANVAAFKHSLLQSYNYEDQMEYIKSQKKHPSQTPTQFFLALNAANENAKQLPDAPADGGLDDTAMRRAFLKAMPNSWQKLFRHANLTIQ